MLRSRAFRLLVTVAFGVLLVLIAWVGWQVWQVNRDLSTAVGHGQRIQAAVERRDTEAVERELDALRKASASAADRTSSPSWAALTKMPVFGDDAEGIEVVSQVLDDLAADGIEPLMSLSDRFDDLLPAGGAVDLQVVGELSGPVAAAEQAFATADERLAGQDPDAFVGRLDSRFTEFRDQVNRASSVLRSAQVATTVLPTMLGEEQPRRYLLAFQNNAEVRGGGGLPGAVSYLRVTGGKIEIERQVTGGSFGVTPKPVLPLSPAEEALYGDVLGTYFVDATMTPDVPRAAELMRAHSARVNPRLDLDGVLLVDTVAMAYLLEATGPITVDGTKVSGDNVVDELLHNTYRRLDPAGQDAFFAKVAETAFDRVTSGGEPAGMLKAFARAADERRIFVHSFDPTVQREIAGTEIAGEFASDPRDPAPHIDVTLNDTTGSKMSYFLRYDVDVQATSCVNGVQGYQAKARLSSTAPDDAATYPPSVTGGGFYGVDPGTQIVTVRIFAPVGGTVDHFELNARAMDLVEVDQDGRPVGMTYIELKPGQTVDLAWRMSSGPGQTADSELVITPTIEKKDTAVSLESACR